MQALRSCVQLYGPLGFRATLGFLEENAGHYPRDEGALLRALDMLTASRQVWLVEVDAYAQRRREAKHLGQRSPGPDEPNPVAFPRIWYGAARPAALYGLRFLRREDRGGLLSGSDAMSTAVRACVDSAVASDGFLTTAQQELLAATVAELRRRTRPEMLHRDRPVYGQAWLLLKPARLAAIAATDGRDDL